MDGITPLAEVYVDGHGCSGGLASTSCAVLHERAAYKIRFPEEFFEVPGTEEPGFSSLMGCVVGLS